MLVVVHYRFSSINSFELLYSAAFRRFALDPRYLSYAPSLLEIPTPLVKIVEDFTKLRYAVLCMNGIHHLMLLKQLAFAKSCPINRTDDLNSYAVL